MVFECPALQGVRDKYAALFVDGASTMQQFMWQQDVIGVYTNVILSLRSALCPGLL